jgi:hypothetical protein
VTVKLEVPEARLAAGGVEGCMAARLYVNEAGNTALPKELDATTSIAANCADDGSPAPAKRIVTYSRMNPKAGLWDLHVFGRYQFGASDYKLTVEYAKVKTSVDQIAGPETALNGALAFSILEASFAVAPDAAKSTFKLAGLQQVVNPVIKLDEQQKVPDADGKIARSYDAGVSAVTISTGGAAGNDLDLLVYECDDEALATCDALDQSAGATDVEAVTFAPKVDKFYYALVIGYAINTSSGAYTFTERRSLAKTEDGHVAITAAGADTFKLDYTFDVGASGILKNPLFRSGKYQAVGDLQISTPEGSTMTRLPIVITKDPATP